MASFDLVIRNTSEVLTLEGEAPDALGPLPRGVVGVAAGKVVFLGEESALPPGAVGPQTQVLDAEGGFVGPGFVDAHTHLVFAGERAEEFDQRNQGIGYLEIARAGGGIRATVSAVRRSSEQQLVDLARPRVRRLLAHGVTTAEVKSGYGLSLADELKMLRAVRQLGEEEAVTLVPTLLCAHAIPEEHQSDRAGYLRLCAEQIIPQVARESLAGACDVFVEEGAFTVAEARALLGAARRSGMVLRLHADQLTCSGGALLAAELGARSADHLEQVDAAGIAALARAKVVAVLAPVSTLFLKVRPYAPGRRLIAAGVQVALATNVNPGSAMSENVGLTLGLADRKSVV